MLDYIFQVKPLEDAGLSNQEIAEQLSSATALPMSPDQSKSILQETGAVIADPVVVNQRSGSLISHYQSLADDSPSKLLIAWFIASVYDGVPARTDSYPKSVQFKQVEDSLPDALKLVAGKLVAAAGGRPNASVTEQDIIDSKAAWQQAEADRIAQEQALEQQRQAEQAEIEKLQKNEADYWGLHNLHIAILQDSKETDRTVWRAGIQAILDGWTVD